MNFLHSYKGAKVLITGTTGFKGSWLALWLDFLGSNVVGVSLPPEKDSIIFKTLNINNKIKQFYVDIRNLKEINSIIKKEKPDIIFHLAAQSIVSKSLTDPYQTFDVNVIGSLNILEAYRQNNIENLVFITSDKSYKNNEWQWSYRENDILFGDDPYSASKSCAEIVFHSYYKSFFNKNKFLKLASTRAGNVIGGGDMKKNRIIPDIVKSVISNQNIIIRSPNSTRPWQNILDVLHGYLLLGSKLINNNLKNVYQPSWNFGPDSQNCKSVNEVAKLFLKKWSNQNTKIIIDKSNKFTEAGLLMLNNEKAKIELGWFPKYSFEDSINVTVDWYKNYANKIDMEKFSIEQIYNFMNK